MIANLVRQNKDLKETIERNRADVLLMPNFLADMVQHEAKNRKLSKHAASYSLYMQNVALYIFTLAGRKAYETIHLNLQKTLPSLTTLKRLLRKKSSMAEGQFRFDFIKTQLEQKGEPLFVIASEDDTKISERLRYNYSTDEVLGLQLPLVGGIPVCGSFKFTTFSAVQRYVEANPLSSYAKLITIRSLAPNSTVYHLVIYGTNGSDNFADVIARWEFVARELSQIGITLVCKIFKALH